jgi:hypothetical protein
MSGSNFPMSDSDSLMSDSDLLTSIICQKMQENDGF